VDRLRQQLSGGKSATTVSLGEGVRSAIVTMSSATRCAPSVPSVSTVSQPKASVAQAVTSGDSQHSYATVSSVKMNATIPPPPTTRAPPPKALTNSSNANAFQNMTYNLEATTPPTTTSSSSTTTTNNNKTGAAPARKLSASGAGRGTPPPIPPNKPAIKPVLPPQALLDRNKELNSTKVNAKSAAMTAATNLKSTTIGGNESTGRHQEVL